MDINKYIGIPYKSKGYGFDGADCYGLLWLFMKEELDIILPMFEQYNPYEDAKEVANQIDINLPLLTGKQVDTPKFGDVVLFRFRGAPSHFGVYIESNKVLHILKGTDSTYESINSVRLKGRIEGIYELKKQN